MTKLTPMMAQYRQIKAEYSDAILMFRLGDFYEMFFEDAIAASKILQITLTARNKGGDNKAPMCGIPYHALDNYLVKLSRAGKKVAICDQVTAPDGKGIVERKVVRVVTPGTTFDENILEGKANNFVACVVMRGERFAFSYADITTGEFKVSEFSKVNEVRDEFSRVMPAECICEEQLAEIVRNIRKETVVFPFMWIEDGGEKMKKHFGVNSFKAFGLDGRDLGLSAAAMLFEYLKETQKTDLAHIRSVSFYSRADFMALDESCIRNLELFYTNRGEKSGSLISILDQTVTSMGGRLLRNFLLHPLIERVEIENRLEKVEIFSKDSSLLREVREKLGGIFDIERLLSRLSLGSGNARDLKAMQKSLEQVPALRNLAANYDLLQDVEADLSEMKELVSVIDKAISDEAPMSVRDGGMVKEGFNQELDELRLISREGKTYLKNLQEREAKRTGISSLKIKYNRVFGYYIEISKSNLGAVPENYIRKQTLVNAERFITPELKEYEEKVLSAEDRIKELEYELFYQVRMEVVKEINAIQGVAKAVALLDVFSSLAYLAVKNDYCKPVILDEKVLEIEAGRHPVVEDLSGSGNFVPNNCEMNSERDFLLITGPNMGGKSTFLRQTALIVLMAQIGSFVPASTAKIGLVDRIFTRVGASDNLSRGESTFMVEMQEAAYILHNASEKSLIIFDELGRGTSTYDGVSIAWAVMEYVHDRISARTLFATHYHELIELAGKLGRAHNLSAAVVENEKDGVVFLYKIVEGGVDKSYGIEVAKLAGMPVDIINRARGVLSELERKQIKEKRFDKDQMALFEGKEREHKKVKGKENSLLHELKSLKLDEMTPLQAMNKLQEIKEKSS